jgi:hypothetical protein
MLSSSKRDRHCAVLLFESLQHRGSFKCTESSTCSLNCTWDFWLTNFKHFESQINEKVRGVGVDLGHIGSSVKDNQYNNRTREQIYNEDVIVVEDLQPMRSQLLIGKHVVKSTKYWEILLTTFPCFCIRLIVHLHTMPLESNPRFSDKESKDCTASSWTKCMQEFMKKQQT